MRNWLHHHRRTVILTLCLLVAALIGLMIAFALLPDGRTYINAWYV